MQKEGKILHLGLSNASQERFDIAAKMINIATVENLYSYSQRTTDPASPFGFQGGEVLAVCEQMQIPFIPFFSLQTSLPSAPNKMEDVAAAKGVSVAQLNIAWLLHRSPWILPIPGTTSIDHLVENIDAVNISLSAEELEFLG
jgi:aryl-alcohol dehydrogenase-like predicted oxidoreductase